MTFLIQQTLLYAVPLMIVALAGVFAERSDIINLALEGIMIFGAFIGVLFVIILLYSLASVLPLVAATGLVAGGILYWVQNYAFLLIVLAVLFFAFRRAGRKG